MALYSRQRWRRLKSRAWTLPRIARGLRLFFPMTRDVMGGRYRPVPWKAFALMAGAIGYLVMPFDLIPDFILPFGLLDDAVIVSWLLARVDEQLDAYRAWQDGRSR
ncbi:YkvA family protein [Halomonas garicola]|uniref:YkvA family protein n=1 Tax=Halomonas garicola TaxID=1690008 RepID=UPI002898E5BE|nr:YkvA family protein [Halomonas garicola]